MSTPTAGGEGVPTPPNNTATPQRCNLAAYAAVTQLPLAALKGLGLGDVYLDGPAVRISYTDAAGSEVCVRFRLSLDGANRWRWRGRDKPALYGQQFLELGRSLGRITIVDDEADQQTLVLHGIPAVAVPGTESWRDEWASLFDGIGTIYVDAIGSDDGALRARLTTSPLRDRLQILDGGSPNGLYRQGPEQFVERWERRCAFAVPWRDVSEQEQAAKTNELWSACEPIARLPSILDAFAATLVRLGVAGEAKTAKLLYLAFTSRLLDRPISAAVKGPSSGGKSYVVERVSQFFPPTAFYALSAMSERALAYSDESLSHRMLVIYEAAGLAGDLATYLLRSLLSEGRVRYETVEKTRDGLRPRLIEREGPTGLILTTTAASLHPENETRLLSLTIDDTREQTRQILDRLADEDTRESVDLGAWRALQGWLEIGDCDVTIPFARELVGKIPPLATRLRRDVAALLNLIRTHALLHRATRDRATDGRIVATLDDYAAVRELVSDLLADGLGATISPATRETVKAVVHLLATMPEVSVAALAGELKLDKSTVSRRVKVAIDRGFLKNEEQKRGQPARLVIGEPLPNDEEVLPTVGVLQCCSVAEGDTIPSPLPAANGTANGYTHLPDDWLTSDWREVHDGEVLPNGALTYADLTSGRSFARLDDGTRPGVPLVPCPTCGTSALRLGSYSDGGRGRFDCPSCGVIWLPLTVASS